MGAVTFMPWQFTSGDKSFLTHWIGDWLEPRTGRNLREQSVLQKTETDRPVLQANRSLTGYPCWLQTSSIYLTIMGPCIVRLF